MFDGRIFGAKWWIRNHGPEAALQGSADSPWLRLKNDAVAKMLAEKSAK